MNLVSSLVFPVGRLIITHHSRTYSLSYNVTLTVFMTLLQHTSHNSAILTFHHRLTAKTVLLDTVGLPRHLNLIIESHSFRTLIKRNTNVESLFAILSTSNRFLHISQEQRTRGQHRNIYHTKHLHLFYMSLKLCTIPISSFFRIDTCISLYYPYYLSHYIRISPRRSAFIGIGFISIYHLRRTKFIKQLRITTDNTRLVYFTSHPMIHITVFQRHYFLLRKRAENQS